MHRHKRNVLGRLRVLGQAGSYIVKVAVVLGSGSVVCNKTGFESVRFLVRPEDQYTAPWSGQRQLGGYLSESHYIHT